MLEAAVTMRDIVDLAVVEIVARGRWTWRLRVDLLAAVRKALAQQPRALVLDVGGLLDVDRALTPTVLLAEQQGAVQRPRVPLVVVGGADHVARLHASGVASRVPVHRDRAVAVHQLAGTTPPFGRARLHLQPSVLSPSEARNLVDDTCRAWGLLSLLYPARLVMSELATNAVDHAGTPFTVTMTRRAADLVHLAVEDEVPALPRMRVWPKEVTVTAAMRGNGLRLVAGAATAWGCDRTARGKVVWATLRARPV